MLGWRLRRKWQAITKALPNDVAVRKHEFDFQHSTPDSFFLKQKLRYSASHTVTNRNFQNKIMGRSSGIGSVVRVAKFTKNRLKERRKGQKGGKRHQKHGNKSRGTEKTSNKATSPTSSKARVWICVMDLVYRWVVQVWCWWTFLAYIQVAARSVDALRQDGTIEVDIELILEIARQPADRRLPKDQNVLAIWLYVYVRSYCCRKLTVGIA